MKYFLYALFLAASCGLTVFAQQKDKQALLRAIRKLPDTDTNKIRACIDYGYWYEAYNLDSAAHYYLIAGRLSRQLSNMNGLMDYYANYTYVLNQQGKLQLSRKLNLEALAIARKTKDPLRIATCLFNTGSSYNNSGKYEQAAHFYIRAAKLFEQMHMEREMVIVNDNIGGIFTNIGQGEEALLYSKKALTNARKLGDTVLLAKTLINSSLAQSQVGQLRAAAVNAREGLQLSRITHHPELECTALNSLAEIRFGENRPGSGLRLSREALRLSQQIDSKYSEMEALKLLASGYLRVNQYDSTVIYANRAILFGNTHQFHSDLYKLYDIMSSGYAGKKEFAQAYEALGHSVHLKDSISQTKLDQKVRQLDARYQHFQSQRQISDLEQSATKNQLLIAMLIAALLAGTLIGLLIYRNIREKKLTTETILTSRENEILRLERAQQLLAAEAILQGQEEERSRLARDLHDGLGGLLSGIKLTLVQPESTEEQPGRALEQLDHAIDEMRRIAHSMMPEALVRFGLPDALSDFCSAFERQDQLSVHLQVFGMEKRLGQNTEIMLYRIVQELVNNAVKHGKATEIFVQLVRNDNRLSLTVEDNGSGFDPEKSEGFGLKNVRSRVKLLNGAIDIQSEEAVGTTLNIDINLRNYE